MRMSDEQIGGAVVRRSFKMGDRHVMSGTRLTRDEVLSIRTLNRRSMVDRGIIDLFPVSEIALGTGERFAFHTGGGKFTVVEGKVIDSGLDKATALKLAKKPKPS